MNREDQNFDQLRRLLKLKRYEQPPPRYFNDFSTRIFARLKDDQSATLGGNWLQRLWGAFELRPVVPAAFGAAICGLLVLGAVYVERTEVPHELLQLTSGENGTAVPQGGITTATPLPLSPDSLLANFSTNPVTSSGSLFDQIGPGGTQPSKRVAHPLFK